MPPRQRYKHDIKTGLERKERRCVKWTRPAKRGKLVGSFHHDKRPSGFLLTERPLVSEEGDYQIDLENKVVLTWVTIGTINRAIETMDT